MSKRRSSSNVGQLTLYDGLKKNSTDESSSSNAHTGRGMSYLTHAPLYACHIH